MIASLIGQAITGKFLAIGIAGAVSVTTLAVGVASRVAYNKGVAADKQRSDLVISGMVNKALEDSVAANRRNAAITAELEATKERHARDLQTERERNTARVVVATGPGADRVRKQLTTIARGPGPGTDTVPACREDASGLGDVLATALRAHAVCTGNAEEEAGSARALLGAWPVVSRRP